VRIFVALPHEFIYSQGIFTTEAARLVQNGILIVISATLISMLAINARVPGSNLTIDGHFSTSLKALG